MEDKMEIQKDERFLLAENYVERTGVSLFLTGRAGTGKTTFLRHICDTTTKRHVILAPTGVAAINAGGSTIHSFFRLPLCPYLPDVKELVTEYRMEGKYRSLPKERIKLIRTLDLMIIDEVSMVRADLMDAVDTTLRRYRRNDRPFGGVQLLMIGDVHQLPPVIKDDVGQYIGRVYDSPYFFDSKAVRRLRYISIELATVYRQKDSGFVEILDAVRDGRLTCELLQKLNSRVGAALPGGTEPIRLMTHNRQSADWNSSRLDALKGGSVVYDAEIDGEFPETSYPAEQSIVLKKGARVMFIRNDSCGDYYNGKMGTVESLSETCVTVSCDDGTGVCVSPVKWENTRYGLDSDTGEVRQSIIGTFTQIPLRTAWAITIHKSQGLTFDKVVIDAGAAFAFGQIYVALSRCRSLEGISLSTPISRDSLYRDDNVAQFDASAPTTAQSAAIFDNEELSYRFERMRETFDMERASSALGWMSKVWRESLSTLYATQGAELSAARQRLRDASQVATRFRSQLSQLELSLKNCIATCDPASGDPEKFLAGRLSKASDYFLPIIRDIQEVCSRLSTVEVDNKEVRRQLTESSEAALTELDIIVSSLETILKEGYTISGINAARNHARLTDHITGSSGQKRLRRRTPSSGDDTPGTVNEELRAALQEWRSARFQADNVPAYTIMHQSTLLTIASIVPHTREELLSVKGFGEAKYAKYGKEILDICKTYNNNDNSTDHGPAAHNDGGLPE